MCSSGASDSTYHFEYEWERAALAFEAAEEVFGAATGCEWERTTARFMTCQAHLQVGSIRRVEALTRGYLDDARRRGDLYARSLWLEPWVWAPLVDDDVPAAYAAIAGVLDGWPEGAYLMVHHLEHVARATVLTYEGAHADALAVVRDDLAGMRAAYLDRVPALLGQSLRTAAIAAVYTGDRAIVERTIRWAARQDATAAVAFAELLRAWCADRDGDRGRALAHLQSARDGFDAATWKVLAAATRVRIGRLIGGAAGEPLIAEGMRWFTDQRVANVERMLRYLVPGFD